MYNTSGIKLLARLRNLEETVEVKVELSTKELESAWNHRVWRSVVSRKRHLASIR